VANILSDVISRNEVEEALGMSEEKYRMLFEECKDVIFVSTPEGDLIDINPAGVELFEYKSKEAMMQINIQQELFLKEKDREEYQKIMAECGFVKDFQLRLKTKTGRILFVEETSTAVRDAKERIVAYRGIIRDVTNVRKLQQELSKAQSSESPEPPTHLAFELLNIFTTLSSYCDLMGLKVTDHDPYDEYIRQMERAVRKGISLTHELFDFSKE
jgi:PAS domain S-box-containing protein